MEPSNDFLRTDARFWLELGYLLWLAILTGWTYLSRRSQVNRERIEELEESSQEHFRSLESKMYNYAPSVRLDAMEAKFEQRFDGLSERLASLPTGQELHAMSAELRALREAVIGNERDHRHMHETLNRLDQWLRERDR